MWNNTVSWSTIINRILGGGGGGGGQGGGGGREGEGLRGGGDKQSYLIRCEERLVEDAVTVGSV